MKRYTWTPAPRPTSRSGEYDWDQKLYLVDSATGRIVGYVHLKKSDGGFSTSVTGYADRHSFITIELAKAAVERAQESWWYRFCYWFKTL